MCIRDSLYKRQKAIDVKDRATAIDIKVQLREKEAERKRVETMSVTDALTGLGNRYSLEREAVPVSYTHLLYAGRILQFPRRL